MELHDGAPIRLHDPAKGQTERAAHVEAKFRIALALLNALQMADASCHMLADGMTVKIDEEISYQPDALVYCGNKADPDDLVVETPVIIVEVLSPSTAYKDVSTKLADYFKLPSVSHYLIIDPKLKRVQHHYRDGNKIKLDPLENEKPTLDPPGIELNIAELFA